jgi:hypothetical protein
MWPAIVDGSSIPATFLKSVAGKPFSTPHDDVAAYLHVQSLVTLPSDFEINEASIVLFARLTA